MNNFFEKLTGTPSKKTQSHGVSDDEKKQEIEEESETKHLTVETDINSKNPPETPDEEGELTVDIYDKGDSLIIQSTVAGVKPEDLDVAIANDTVTIRGKRDRHEEIQEKNYYYKELFWGTFSRSIILPEEVDDDLVEATYKHGLLTIRLPKRRRDIIQKVKVRVT